MKSKGHFERAIQELPHDEPLHSSARLRAARRVSSEYGPRYQQLRQVLIKYLSPVLVDSALERSMNARGLTQLNVETADLSELTSDAMLGLRLFVAESKLAELMLELAEVLEKQP